MIGSCKHSDICVFSLHPVKSITTGEGGLITTNNLKYYKNIFQARSLGIDRNKKHWEYNIKNIGLNFRLTEFQSALGLSQLKKIKDFLNYRKKIFNFYKKNLKKLNELKIISKSDEKYSSSNHLFIIRINNASKKLKESFIKYMLRNRIILQYHYIPVYEFDIFEDRYIGKNTKKYYREAISLPIYYNLSYKHLNIIVKKIKNFFNAK